MDTIGLLLTVLITAAGVQDRDGAKPLLWNLRRAFPSVKLAWADGGYAGKLVTWAKTKLKPRLTLQIVKRPGDLHAFQVLPRRWVVERTLAWITRCRRTVRDYERLPGHHETIVYWAMTITMTRRLARRQAAQPTAAYCPGRLLYPGSPARRQLDVRVLRHGCLPLLVSSLITQIYSRSRTITPTPQSGHCLAASRLVRPPRELRQKSASQ